MGGERWQKCGRKRLEPRRSFQCRSLYISIASRKGGHTVSPSSLSTSPTISPNSFPIQLSEPSEGARTISGPSDPWPFSNAARAAALGSAFVGDDRADLTDGISYGTSIIRLTSGNGDEAGKRVLMVSSNACLVVRGLA